MKSLSELIYIAGPYTNPDPVENTHKAIKMGLHIYSATGYGVIIPHLSLAAHLVEPYPLDFWYRWDIAQLRHCTRLFRMEGESTGADNEVEVANQLHIPVYTRLDALLAALQ